MKLIHKRSFWYVVAAIVISLLIAYPEVAERMARNGNENDKSISVNEPEPDIKPDPAPDPKPADPKPGPKPKAPNPTTGVSIKAPHKIAPEKLEAWLASQRAKGITGSPLAPHSAKILESDYWSLIIGICYIEQYRCVSAPSFNFWGIGGESGLKRYASAEAGIAAIDAFLRDRAWNRGRTTIESFRGWYCVNRNYPGNVCPNWESVVKRIKVELESL